MHSLFYTSPLRESHYLAGRFLGGLAVNAVLLLGVPLGLLLASVMPYMSAGKFGPVQPLAYVQTYLLVLLPNLIVIGAFMFAAAALTRQALATYLGGIALFVLSLIAGALTNGLGEPRAVGARRPVRRPRAGADDTVLDACRDQRAAHRVAGRPALESRAVARRRGGSVRTARRALPFRAPGRGGAAPLVASARGGRYRAGAA